MIPGSSFCRMRLYPWSSPHMSFCVGGMFTQTLTLRYCYLVQPEIYSLLGHLESIAPILPNGRAVKHCCCGTSSLLTPDHRGIFHFPRSLVQSSYIPMVEQGIPVNHRAFRQASLRLVNFMDTSMLAEEPIWVLFQLTANGLFLGRNNISMVFLQSCHAL